MPSNTFYVLYVPDGLLASCIDAIKVFAYPGEKYPAHITVRGPYPRAATSGERFSHAVENSLIKINGAGNFFDSGQNTVYLSCEGAVLEDVWDKPEYGFNPHITLYDGPSRKLAMEIWEIVSSHSYDASFMATPLRPLVSSRRYQRGMSLSADLDSRLLREVIGSDLPGWVLQNLQNDARLNAIEKLCDYMSSIGTQSVEHEESDTSRALSDIRIEEININSSLLPAIKSLAKRNSATLGFLPEGAFDAYAQRGWVLAAVDDCEVLGYAVYRVSQMKAVLVHLCTDESHRGTGIARRLFRGIVERTRDLRGIVAHSRRDFPSHRMWPRIGFAAIGEKIGRGRNQAVLTRWWYEHSHPTLFSINALSAAAKTPIDVAIDLNVFYDLVMPSSREGADESLALRSDWLVDEIELCATAELFNEITRLENPQARQEQRTLAHDFKRIAGDADAFTRACSLLFPILGKTDKDRESSDLRHLAHAAASGVEFFITRDSHILELQDAIEATIGVTPMRPTDLLIEIEQVRNKASYQPARLRGSTLRIGKVVRNQRKLLENTFVNTALGEKKNSFQRRLSGLLAKSGTTSPTIVMKDQELIALFGWDQSKPDVFEVPLLRLCNGPLARTLARQIVTTAVDASTANNISLVTVTDEWLEPLVEEALTEGGFVKAGTRWSKLNFPAIGSEGEIASGLRLLVHQLQESGFAPPDYHFQGFNLTEGMSASETVLAEKTFRPLKITNGCLSTFVIPVKALWAKELFDTRLAEQTLFGASPDLLLNWENAYYRSTSLSSKLTAPFRILWYVSQDPRYVDTGKIRAYSVCSNVELLPARIAYNRYRRLGVYNLEHILNISGGDPDALVMVIRFTDTEIFGNPIERKRFGLLLQNSDKKKPILRGPQEISEEAFINIYLEGQGRL